MDALTRGSGDPPKKEGENPENAEIAKIDAQIMSKSGNLPPPSVTIVPYVVSCVVVPCVVSSDSVSPDVIVPYAVVSGAVSVARCAVSPGSVTPLSPLLCPVLSLVPPFLLKLTRSTHPENAEIDEIDAAGKIAVSVVAPEVVTPTVLPRRPGDLPKKGGENPEKS